jgi:hypothetical protein
LKPAHRTNIVSGGDSRSSQEKRVQQAHVEGTLDHLWSALDRCETSFATKLVARTDWDSIVLGKIVMARPRFGRKDRLGYTKAVYHSLGRWYAKYLGSDTGKLIISLFNQTVKEHARITDVKKVDFVLWHTRG